MRRAAICAAMVVVGAAAAPSATAATHPPTAAQITRAVRRATHSSYLWATVNICTPDVRGGGVIGVRGEMPALGFDAALSMTIALREARGSTGRPVDIPGATARRTSALGTVRSGAVQDGAEFPFHADTGTLDARVTFTWTRAGRRLASVTRVTAGGHPSAAFGRPSHFSAATCRL